MSSQVKVGLLAIAAIIIFIFGFSFLKGNKIFNKQDQYFAVYDKVDGLYSSDPIYVNGYQIGKVSSIKLLYPDVNRVLVTFDINNEIKVPKNTVAILYSADFLGEKSIKLIMGDSREYLNPLDTISTVVEKEMLGKLESQITPITDKISNLMLNLDTLVEYLTPLFNSQTDVNIYQTVSSLNSNLARLDAVLKAIDAQKINEMISTLNSQVAEFEKTQIKLQDALDGFGALADTLNNAGIASTLSEAEVALEEMSKLLKAINEGDGTLSAMIKERGVYDNIDSATKSLDFLLKDLQQNPKRYVHISLFGRKDKSEKENN